MPTLFDLDFGVTTPITSPFGFDSVNLPAGATMEVVTITSGGGSTASYGAGVRGGGTPVGIHTTLTGLGMQNTYNGGLISWNDLQPNGYDASGNGIYVKPTWLDSAVDDAIDNGWKFAFRILGAAHSPIGPASPNAPNGTNAATWLTGAADQQNAFRPVPYVDALESESGGLHVHIPVMWNPDGSYNENYAWHIKNLLTWVNSILGGTTAAGHRRADAISHVPIPGPNIVGTEMAWGMGQGSVSLDPVEVVNGIRVGNGTNGAPGVSDIGPFNRPSYQKTMPAAIAASANSVQDTWMRNFVHNLSGAVWHGIAPRDGVWAQLVDHAMGLDNFQSSIAHGHVFGSNAPSQDIIRKYAPFLKTKLWTMRTDLRVRPTPATDSSNSTYAKWSTAAASTYVTALEVTAPGTPLIGFQTASTGGYGGAAGMPPADFEYAARDALNTYKGQFLETYMGVFSQNGSPAGSIQRTNINLVNNEFQAKMRANAEAVGTGTTPGVDRGSLHVVTTTAIATGPTGRMNHAAGKTRIYYRVVIDELTTLSAIETLIFSQVSAGTNNGDLAVRVNATKQLVARWNSASAADWTGGVLNPGDVLEVQHYLNGNASGYEIRVNQAVVHSNFALVSPAGNEITFGQIGLPNAADADIKFSHFGASDTVYLGPPGNTNPVNDEDPTLSITEPSTGSTFTTADPITIAATATDPDGILKVEMRVDGGAWSSMALSGGSYSRSWTPPEQPGEAGAHVIDVRATDNFSVAADQRTSMLTITIGVDIPAVTDDGGTARLSIQVLEPSIIDPVVGHTWKMIHRTKLGDRRIGEQVPEELRFGKYIKSEGYMQYNIAKFDETGELLPLATEQGTDPDLHYSELVRDNMLLFSGPIMNIDLDTDTTVIAVTSAGWKSYFQERAWPFTEDTTSAPDPWFDTDIGTVVSDMLDAVLGAGPTPKFIYSPVELGFKTNYRIEYGDQEYIFDKIRALEDEFPGFDWQITDDRRIIFYPYKRGRRIMDYTLEIGKNIKGVHLTNNGTPGTHSYGYGSGTSTRLINLQENIPLAKATWRRDVITDFGEISDSARLRRRNQAQHNTNNTPAWDLWATVYPEEIANVWKRVDVGDSVRLVADLDYKQINGFYRVTGIEGYLNRNGDEEIVYTFNDVAES